MATAKRPRPPKSTAATKAKTAPVPVVAKVSARAVDTQEAIRYRAYQLFEKRGRQHGYDFEDWVRAEAEVLSTSASSNA
jgi:hypothetical protein